ncbi:hypothetical protein ACFFWB_26775 [Flavobacterium procerum]|uniref:hypothetical protein n=1 Tax=Flavobacterium procerum TaxID=1455569 RepID=UPI0035EDFD83
MGKKRVLIFFPKKIQATEKAFWGFFLTEFLGKKKEIFPKKTVSQIFNGKTGGLKKTCFPKKN